MKMFLSLCALSFMLMGDFYGISQENENNNNQSTSVIAKTLEVNQSQEFAPLAASVSDVAGGACTSPHSQITVAFLEHLLLPSPHFVLSTSICTGLNITFDDCDGSSLDYASTILGMIIEFSKRNPGFIVEFNWINSCNLYVTARSSQPIFEFSAPRPEDDPALIQGDL